MHDEPWMSPKEKSRILRQHATITERLLWRRLRRGGLLGMKFRRQHPVDRWIADFACVERRLIVEIGGATHDDPDRDATRDRALGSLGWRVLRIDDSEVRLRIKDVLERIAAEARGHWGVESNEGRTNPHLSREERSDERERSVRDRRSRTG